MKEFRIALAYTGHIKNGIAAVSKMLNEAHLFINKNEMKINDLDPANVAMVEFKVFPTAAVEWAVDKDVKIGLNIGSLNNVMKNATEHDMMVIKSNDKESILIILKGEIDREYKLPLVDLDNKEQKIPELKFNAQVKMSSNSFAKQIEECDKVSETAILTASKESFILESKNDPMLSLKMTNSPSRNLELKVSKTSKSKYSVEYLKMMIAAKLISSDVTVEFANDYPLKLTYVEKERVQMTYVLAPRVDNE